MDDISYIEFFHYYNKKCPLKIAGQHTLDTERKCEVCGFVTKTEWRRSNDGKKYYDLYIERYNIDIICKKINKIVSKISKKNLESTQLESNFDKMVNELIKVLSTEIISYKQLQESVKSIFSFIIKDKKMLETYLQMFTEIYHIKYDNVTVLGELLNAAENKCSELLSDKEIYNKNSYKNLMIFIGRLYEEKLINLKLIISIVEWLYDNIYIRNVFNDCIFEMICILLLGLMKTYNKNICIFVKSYSLKMRRISKEQSGRIKWLVNELEQAYSNELEQACSNEL